MAVTLLGVVCVAPASAQTSVGGPNGIQVGEGRLHPFLEVDGRYDSLVGYFSGTPEAPLPSADIVIHARPGLRFNLSNVSTSFTFNGSAEYLFYTGLINPAATQLSRFPTGLRANVGADARFNQDGAVEVQIGDTMTRSDRTQNPAAGIGLLSMFNSVHLAVPIHPGGRGLEITPRIAWQVEFFEPLALGTIAGCAPTDATCSPNLVSQMNYSNISPVLNARWRFLPKTAFVIDVASDIRTYWAGSSSSSPPATMLRAQAGIAGLITARINATIMAGYGGDLSTAAPGSTTQKLHNFIANAEVGFAPNEMMKVSLGYLRTALPAPILGTYIDDRGYLRGNLGLWAGRLTFTLQAMFDRLGFYDATKRVDLVFSGNAAVTFAIVSWFDAGLGYTASYRDSSASALSTKYFRHEVMLRLGVHY